VVIPAVLVALSTVVEVAGGTIPCVVPRCLSRLGCVTAGIVHDYVDAGTVRDHNVLVGSVWAGGLLVGLGLPDWETILLIVGAVHGGTAVAALITYGHPP
jgi:hypothetical protein